MDIERLDRLNKKNRLKNASVLFIIIFLIGIIYWFYNNPNLNQSIKLKDLWISKVEKGDLIISAHAVGKLKTVNNYLITSKVSGTVSQIKKNVGSLVTQGELILILKSETLKQKITETQYNLNQAKAKHQILISDLNIQTLNNESNLFKLKNTIAIQKLKLNAKEKLEKKGIISEIDIQKNRLEVKNLEKELSFEERKIKSFKNSKASKISADLLIIEQIQHKLETEKQLIEDMTIRASMNGIINKIYVKFGEHVIVGQSLVELNDNVKLNAIMLVNESLANKIQYNQEVEIKVLNTTIKAHIKSINPQIKNSSIEIELEINDNLPKGVRADMNVTGDIIFSEIKDTLWVTKPQGISEDQIHSIFVLDEEKKSAFKVEVKFGKESNNKIQILRGLKFGQSIIVNKIDDINQNLKEIEIIQ